MCLREYKNSVFYACFFLFACILINLRQTNLSGPIKPALWIYSLSTAESGSTEWKIKFQHHGQHHFHVWHHVRLRQAL